MTFQFSLPIRPLDLQNVLLVLVFFLILHLGLYSQGSAGANAVYESRTIIDMPTAGVLQRNTLGINIFAGGGGNVITDVSFAPFTNFNIGLGYSGNRVLGTGNIDWQGIPAIHLRYRIIDETLTIPAILLGLQTLGRDGVNDKVFLTRSPGLFAGASKQFRWAIGTISLHGGLGYSLDLGFNGNGVNAWIGLEQSLGSSASFMAEFNPNLNASTSKSLLNLSVRWALVPGVTIELQGRDLFGNLAGSQVWNRTLAVEIIRRL
jgi:hypothetical protein